MSRPGCPGLGGTPCVPEGWFFGDWMGLTTGHFFIAREREVGFKESVSFVEVVMGGVETMAAAIEADLAARLPGQRVTQRRNLALLSAAVLCESEVNLMALGAVLPMATGNRASRSQKLKRILANRHIDPDAVIGPHMRAMFSVC